MPKPADRARSLYFDYPHFAYRAPPRGAGRDRRVAVAVIGAGPVGLCAALELARHGVASVVLDDKASVSEGSRAICIARHSMEGLQQLGLSERFAEAGLGWTHGTTYHGTEPVFRLQMPHSADERFLPMYNLQQQYTELFLAERAMAEPLVDLRWQHRVATVSNGGDAVALGITTPDEAYVLHADWALAADGARSGVRRALDLELHGEAHEGRYVIVDVRMASQHPAERRAYFDPPANPGRTVLVHKQPQDIWRIDYQLGEHEDEAAALAEEAIRARVGRIIDMLGESASWELEWWSVYKAYTLCLDDYRHGRVFFLGDAAHLVPIFGVRGLNSGFADAMNIGWKLAYVVRGLAGAGLLDSYSPERRGATLDIFRHAGRSTRFMAPPSRGFRLLRDAALALAPAHAFARKLLDPRQSRPYTYADSPLNTPSSWPDDGALAPGAAVRNCRLDSGDFLLDLLGRGFTGIHFSTYGLEPAVAQLLSRTLAAADEGARLLTVAAEPRGPGCGHLSDRTGSVFRAFGAGDGAFYLVRPDRHVCARWRNVDAAHVGDALNRALAR